MKFSVVVAATRPDTTPFAINSIQDQTHDDWELIVVGERSNHALRAVVERFAQEDSRIRSAEVTKRGLSHARNAGIDLTRGEYVGMIDDDCEADRHWMAVMIDCFQDSRVGVVGGALISPKAIYGPLTWCPSYVPADAMYDPVANPRRPPDGCDWVGANFALRRSVIDMVGPFDELLGAGAMFGAAEEVDYKLRLERAGVGMRTTPHAIVRHTYGSRRGLGPLLNSQRNYARGNAALAAKLTMMGDDRGIRWYRKNRRAGLREWLRGRPYRLPLDLRRLWYYRSAYDECLQRYTVDEKGLLRPQISG